MDVRLVISNKPIADTDFTPSNSAGDAILSVLTFLEGEYVLVKIFRCESEVDIAISVPTAHHPQPTLALYYDGFLHSAHHPDY